MDKVISLDFWGTVAVFNPAYSAARTQYLARLWNIPDDEAHARYQYIKRSCDFQAERFGSAVTPLVAVKRLLEGTKARTHDAVEILADIEALVREFPPLMHPHIKGTVMELQRYHGYTIGVSSNSNFIRGRLLEQIFQVHWDFEVYSDELGVSKPDPDFFRMVVQQGKRAFGERHRGLITAKDFIHIGDNSICDVRGAERAGMVGWLTKSPDETVQLLEGLVKEESVA